MTELMPAVGRLAQQLVVLHVVQVQRHRHRGRLGDRRGGGGDRGQPPVMEADRVLADLQDHRSVGLLGALDHGFGVLQGDDVEGADRDVARGGAVDQLTRGDQRHIDLPFAADRLTKSNVTRRYTAIQRQQATKSTEHIDADVAGRVGRRHDVLQGGGHDAGGTGGGLGPRPHAVDDRRARHPDRSRGAGRGRPVRVVRARSPPRRHDRAARPHRGSRGREHGRVGGAAGRATATRSHR